MKTGKKDPINKVALFRSTFSRIIGSMPCRFWRCVAFFPPQYNDARHETIRKFYVVTADISAVKESCLGDSRLLQPYLTISLCSYMHSYIEADINDDQVKMQSNIVLYIRRPPSILMKKTRPSFKAAKKILKVITVSMRKFWQKRCLHFWPSQILRQWTTQPITKTSQIAKSCRRKSQIKFIKFWRARKNWILCIPHGYDRELYLFSGRHRRPSRKTAFCSNRRSRGALTMR